MSTQSLPRNASQPSSHDAGRPQPAKPERATMNPRRAKLPRGRIPSTFLLGPKESLEVVDDETAEELRDVVREQIDRDSLRDLAEFFRTTAPPGVDLDDLDSYPGCFGPAGPGEHKRWSMRRGRRSKSRPHSLDLILPETAVPGKTIGGHRYIAIEVTTLIEQESHPNENPQTQLRPFAPSGPSSSRFANDGKPTEWPERTSSRGGLSPTREQHPPIPILSESGDSGQGNGAKSDASENPRNSVRLSVRALTSDSGVRNYLRLVDQAFNFDADTLTPNHNVVAPKVVEAEESQATQPTPSPQATSPPEDEPSSTAQVASQTPSATPEPTEPTPEAPMTPPATMQTFPEVIVEPPKPSPRTSPKSFSHRRKLSALSAFPSTNSRPSSPKATVKPFKPPPANILVARPSGSLAVPIESPLPESPGFPVMLASITFPSPPKTAPSSSPTNSQGTGSPTTPPYWKQPGSASEPGTPQDESLDSRVMQPVPVRPALRQSKSDGPLQHYTTSTPTVLISLSTSPTPSESKVTELSEDASAAEEVLSQLGSGDSAATAKAAPSSSGSMSPAAAENIEAWRRSTSSHVTATTDSFRRSGGTNSVRDSSLSETSMSDGAETPDDSAPRTKRRSRRESSDWRTASDGTRQTDKTIHRARSTESVKDRVRAIERRESDESVRRQEYERRAPSERSETPTSMYSVSSSATTRSLAERRMARKAKVREKVQRDLDASRVIPKPARIPAPLPLGDGIDSPILGFFPQHVVRTRGKPMQQGPSPLAQATNGSSSPDTPNRPSHTHHGSHASHASMVSHTSHASYASRRSSVQAVADWIPETVPEASTPVTATFSHTSCSLSPVMMVTEYEPELPPEPEEESTEPEESQVTLSISPLMVVANIEAKPPGSLRPLSLLNPDAQLQRASLRSSLKSQPRNRPLPIKVGGTLASGPGVVTSHSKMNRNSFSNMPTPPLSPEVQSPKRMSLPLQSISLGESSRGREAPPLAQNDERGWLMAHQRETAQEWRIAAIKARLQREMIQREKEVTEQQQQTAKETTEQVHRREAEQQLSSNGLGISPGVGPGSVLTAESGLSSPVTSTVSSEKYLNSTEIEQRLERLEKNGNAWMSVMMPLLENMNRTLREMQRQSLPRSLGSPDLPLDMLRAAKRQSWLSQPTPVGTGFDGSGSEASSTPARRTRSLSVPRREQREDRDSLDLSQAINYLRDVQSPTERPKGSPRSSIGRSQDEYDYDEPEERSLGDLEAVEEEEEEDEEGEDDDQDSKDEDARTIIGEASPSTKGLTSIEEQTQEAIRRQMEQQELVEGFMHRWGLPSPRLSVNFESMA